VTIQAEMAWFELLEKKEDRRKKRKYQCNERQGVGKLGENDNFK